MRKVNKIVNKTYRLIRNRILNTDKKDLIIITLCSVLFLSVSITFGRYVYKEVRNFYLASKNFYFYSDKLKDNMARYQIDNWSGVDTFSITINMNSLKNNKIGTNSDILYDISFTCSNNISCEVSKNSGIILASSHYDYFIIELTPNQALQEGDSVNIYVEANATSPYTKKISGYFVINVGTPGLSYEINDVNNKPYLLLDITNTIDYYKVIDSFDNYQVGDKIDISTYLGLTEENKNKCASAIITLEFNPNTVLLDMTSSVYLKSFNREMIAIDGFNYINKISFKIDALSSEVVRFYKKDASLNYTYPFINDVSIIDVSYSI